MQIESRCPLLQSVVLSSSTNKKMLDILSSKKMTKKGGAGAFALFCSASPCLMGAGVAGVRLQLGRKILTNTEAQVGTPGGGEGSSFADASSVIARGASSPAVPSEVEVVNLQCYFGVGGNQRADLKILLKGTRSSGSEEKKSTALVGDDTFQDFLKVALAAFRKDQRPDKVTAWKNAYLGLGPEHVQLVLPSGKVIGPKEVGFLGGSLNDGLAGEIQKVVAAAARENKELHGGNKIDLVVSVIPDGNGLYSKDKLLKHIMEDPWMSVGLLSSDSTHEAVKCDKDIALAAVTRADANLLEFVCEDLRNDREVVLAAVGIYGRSLLYASRDMRADPEIVLVAVRQHMGVWGAEVFLQHISPELKDNREIVLALAQKFGPAALEWASSDLQKDRDVVLAAVQHAEAAFLRDVPIDLQNDREFVRAAVDADWTAFQFASEEMRADPEIVLVALRKAPKLGRYLVLHAVSSELKNNKEAVLQFVTEDAENALHWASRDLQKDRDVVLAAVRAEGRSIRYASPEMQVDLGIILAAFEQDPGALRCLPDGLLKSRDFKLNVLGPLEQVKALVVALKTRFDELPTDDEVRVAVARLNSIL
ncbi:unnamed protein product [Amoebophrya sp. A25]|nr:unnamed protein product [Amoebophrya sp. A25]|eukprot:GSA25T00025476001.1